MATENKALTVQQLFEACKNQIKQGNGNKHILISGDEEGNYFHPMYFEFTPTKGTDIAYALPFSPEEFDENYVILG